MERDHKLDKNAYLTINLDVSAQAALRYAEGVRMKTACIFPGQGSQNAGMGEDLFKKYPEYVKIADEILGYSIARLCLKDEHQLLSSTRYAQPALFVVNALSYLDYLDANPAPVYLAGHSLGEYNALMASGILSFEEGLRLVAVRGKLMARILDGAMAAVIGIDRKELQNILDEHCTEVEIANYNSYLQNVISGPAEKIEECGKLFKELKLKYMKLNVSGAFHSKYMEPVKEEFDAALNKVHFKVPQITVLSNYTSLPVTEDNVRANLSMQLVRPVKWIDIVETLLKETDEITQIGPGAVLDNLTKRIQKGK